MWVVSCMAYHVSILYSVSMVSCSEDSICTDGLSCEYPVLSEYGVL